MREALRMAGHVVAREAQEEENGTAKLVLKVLTLSVEEQDVEVGNQV
jgi:hypothetical protein